MASRGAVQNQLERVNRGLQRLDSQWAKLLDHDMEGDYPQDLVHRRQAELRRQQVALERERAEILETLGDRPDLTPEKIHAL